MRKSPAMSERSPASASGGLSAAGPVIHRASAAIGAVALSPLAPSAGRRFTTPRTHAEAIDGSDRVFFLRVLAGLIAATLACGLIAMSGVVTIPLP